MDSDYIFEDRETIDKVFTDYKKTEQWLAQAYTYLLGQCCDVASKRNTPFVFDDCMYYGDDDVTAVSYTHLDVYKRQLGVATTIFGHQRYVISIIIMCFIIHGLYGEMSGEVM